jgi:hypothetical protein
MLTILIFISGITLTNAAKVPAGANLKITFEYKENNNLLRNKGTGYASQKDSYAATIWVEGPYDPGTPCQITNYERENIKLVKVITYMAYGLDRGDTAIVPNSWGYVDYNTPDFLAALVVAGKYYYCSPPPPETQRCATAVLAQINSQRQNRTTGGKYCDVSSTVCYPMNPSIGWFQATGDVTYIPDGVSGATVFPGSTVVYNWDMKDYNDVLVDEGHYLVYVQMSAERSDRSIEADKLVSGKVVVGIETCWDDPTYDTRGQHRVVNLFQFKDSAFTKTDYKERKWSGDTFNYLHGGMKFDYTTSSAVINGSYLKDPGGVLEIYPNPANTRIMIRILDSGKLKVTGHKSRLDIFDLSGSMVKSFLVPPGQKVSWQGRDKYGILLPSGIYLARLLVDNNIFIRRFILNR